MIFARRSIVVLLALVSTSLFAQDVFSGCGMEGKVKVQSPTARKRLEDLNRLKNRYNLPSTSAVNTNVTLATMLRNGNDTNRWKTSQAAVVEGYVYAVKSGGSETCNCGATDPRYRDTHIELTLGELPSQVTNTRQVVVEITPRLRKKMKDQGIDWTTAGLRNTIRHHRIRVKGWLFFDAEHDDESENTNPHGPNNWRATAWEIHPVTAIEVLGNP